jgi:triphosphoribosyl-dephospho-CoA synthase
MSALIARQAQPSQAERLADLAVQALIDEADLSPKPGLVDRRGNGAHDDLHLGLMHASAHALWPAFKAMAEAAQQIGEVGQPLRETLGQLGRVGEAEMLRVTGGVNTHRGAIWALGLLSAAAALEADAPNARGVAATAAALARLSDPAAPVTSDSHGARVCRTYGVLGAREQAQHGFPSVIEQGLPQLLVSRRSGAGEQNARLDALLAIMSTLTDTCVLHRAGLEGLARMQVGARAVLAAGGAASLDGRRQLRDLDRNMLALNASPGGAADLLAATLFLDRLAPAASAPTGSN